MVLVTGGAGLVGKELIIQLLFSGKKVKAIWNKSQISITDANLIVVECSILDVITLEEVLEGVEEVYHCAGLVSFLPQDQGKLYKINVEGTANIVNACLNAGIRKMVYVSSVSSLGRLRHGETVTEKMQWTKETSNSSYGESKYLGEMEVWRGIAEGLNAVIVNPVIILGAGDWNDSSTKLFKSAYNEFPWYTNGMTGFVDVRDVASAMIMLMNSDVTAEKFILSSGNETYRNILNKIAVAFNKRPPSKEVSPFMAGIVWRWQALKSKFTSGTPLITRETASTALASVMFDNSKLLSFFPEFKYRSLDETINDTCMLLQQKVNNH